MEQAHIHLDEFARLKSFFHQFDPRVKIVSCLMLLVIVVSLRTLAGLLFALLFTSLMIFGSHLPLGRIVKRLGFVVPMLVVLCLFLPFARPGTPVFKVPLGILTLTYSWEGLQASAIFFLRLLCGALIVILVTFTTPFHVLLHSLADLRVPPIFIQLIQFTLRYFFVLYDETIRMFRARRARNFKAARNFWSGRTFSTLGGLLGMLFIRSYERGERVYYAMLARGFQGEIRVLDQFQVRPRDLLLGMSLIVLGVLSLIIDRGGWGWAHFLR